MADATALALHKTRVRGKSAYPVADTVRLYEGQLAQLEAGYLNHWDGTGRFVGIVLRGDDTADSAAAGQIIGDTSGTPAPDPEGHVDETGPILMRLAGVGGTPTQAKVGDLVFCSDSDVANLTLADNGLPPVGTLSRFRSATDVDVKLFTPDEALVAAQAVYQMTFQFDLVDIADGDLVTDLTIGHRFQVLESYFAVTEAVTTAGDGTTLSLDIGATVITNSEIVLTSANATPAGVIINNAGALALNVGGAADTLTVKAASTTAFAEGKGTLIIRIRALP